MRSVVEIGASVPAFLGKLWKLVNDTETNHLISWSHGGKTFVIKNQADFARDLLPLYYKHNNMASFIRQLNMYGFHKITSVENGGLRYEKDEIEFSHPCFMRGHAYLLEHIKRKIANPKTIVTSGESGEKILLKPELMNKVLADVKQMKGKQESLDAKFSAMKQENEALWREVAILRQKHIKQQQIVNNLIQFLMSLVQPTRPANANGNNVGVKRPYQLMINSAAHDATADGTYPGRQKNIKMDRENVMEEMNEDNLEDGPTIHELAHDDILQAEVSQDSLDPSNFITVTVPPNTKFPQNIDPSGSVQYQVTMEDGDDMENGVRIAYPVSKINNLLGADNQPIVTSPSPTLPTPASPLDQSILDQVFVNAPTQITNKSKSQKNVTRANTTRDKVAGQTSFNSLNPSADLKLPAEIFADDDSIDTGIVTPDNVTLQQVLQNTLDEPTMSTSKDKMFGGVNIKLERKTDNSKTTKKSKKPTRENNAQLNLADIKTELQDEFDLDNMTLATVNNGDVNRYNSMARRDNISKNLEEYSSLFGANTNKTDIDDHLDSMQTDIESLRELLRGDNYSLDTNTLLGLFGSDDPFYGLSYNPVDDRAKASNSAEGNQLMSYTGNIPYFEDLNLVMEGENSQETPPPPSPSSYTLNTPQVQLDSPGFPNKH